MDEQMNLFHFFAAASAATAVDVPPFRINHNYALSHSFNSICSLVPQR